MPFPIAAAIAAIGLPVLTRVLEGALGRIDHPAAKGAAEALRHVGGAVAGRAIGPEQVADANRHIEAMARLEAEQIKTALAEVNQTFRAEVGSDDAYVRRWRPTFGYAVAFTWCLQVAGLVYAIVARPADAAAIVAAMDSLTVIWGVALSVLGVSVVKRSADKAAAAGAPPGGVVGAVIQAIANRRKG
jgi:hypothetical protein